MALDLDLSGLREQLAMANMVPGQSTPVVDNAVSGNVPQTLSVPGIVPKTNNAIAPTESGGIWDKIKGVVSKDKLPMVGMLLSQYGAAMSAPPEQRGAILARIPGNIALIKVAQEKAKRDAEKAKRDELAQQLAVKKLFAPKYASQWFTDKQGNYKQFEEGQSPPPGFRPTNEKEVNVPKLQPYFDENGKKRYGYLDSSGIPHPVGGAETKEPTLKLTSDEEGNTSYAVPYPGMPGPKQASAPIDPQAVDYVAKIFNQTGEMPAMGMGAADFRKAVLSRAAQLAGFEGTSPNDVIQNKAFYSSLKSGLTQLEKQKTMVSAFTDNFDRNLQLAKEASTKLDRTGVPIFNAWLNAGRRSVTGLPELSAFDTYIKTAINEFTRITTTANAGNTQMAEQEIAKVEKLLNAAQTPEQFDAVLVAMENETKNRMKSFDSAIKIKRDQIRELSTPGGNRSKGGSATQTKTTDIKQMTNQELIDAYKRAKGF